MKIKTRLLIFGGILCLLGAGFDSAPVLAVGIAVLAVGLIILVTEKL